MIKRWLLVVVMVFSMVVPFATAPSAEAFAGRARWFGYFFNQRDNNGWDVMLFGIWPSGASQAAKANSFISRVRSQLDGGTAENKTASQFIILTMLGYGPGTPKGWIADSSSPLYDDWQRRVLAYSAAGWANFDDYASYSSTENTYWQGNNGGCYAGYTCNPNDVAWYQSSAYGDAITFHRPGSSAYYVIRKECGNPLGDLGALEEPDYNVTLSAAALTSENGASPYMVVAGSTYSMQAVVHNNGPANSGAGVLQVMWPGAAVCSPGAGCPLSQTQVPAGGATSRGFRAANGIGGAVGPGPNWYWTTPAFGSGGGVTAQMQFTPVGAVGTTFNLEVYYTPGDLGGAVRHVTIPYRIVSKRVPGISGANSDIHAGGGLCAQAATAGNVTTSTTGVSRGEYVVSASGSINSLFSNNATTSATDRLKAGATGAYATVCRPDLLAAVNAEYPLATGISYIGGGPGSTTTLNLTGNEEGVYYFNGAHLLLSGVVSNATGTKPLTIVARLGDVEINGNITLANNVYLPHDVPSLGIISRDDIKINPSVTRVDAYLFSSTGTILTCNGTVAQCATPQLLINGFIMGRSLSFGRVGPTNTNGTPITESIVMTPQLYLNPPRYFDASVDNLLLKGQGERAPKF